MSLRHGLPLLLALAVALVACGPADPSVSLYAKNESNRQSMVRILWDGTGNESVADPVFVLPPGSSLWIYPHVGYGPIAFETLTEACDVLSHVPLDPSASGLISVASNGAATFTTDSAMPEGLGQAAEVDSCPNLSPG